MNLANMYINLGDDRQSGAKTRRRFGQPTGQLEAVQHVSPTPGSRFAAPR